MTEAPSLLDRIQDLVERESFALPVFNEAAFRLRALASEDCDIGEVESVIMGDQALAAEVLRVANSAFFRGLCEIRTIRSAVMRIGLHEVIKIVSMASERSKYQARDPMLIPIMQELWRNTSASTLAADWLARRLGDPSHEEVFLAGLLHDIGELVLLRALDEFKTSGDPAFPLSPELIYEVLSSAHTQAGFGYLKLLRIPETYCRIARDHHQDHCDTEDRLMAMIRIADLVVCKTGTGLYSDSSLVLANAPEATLLDIDEIVLAELEITVEDFVRSPA